MAGGLVNSYLYRVALDASGGVWVGTAARLAGHSASASDYTPHTYQPAVHTGFAFHEYLALLRQHLDETWGTDRGITINFWGLGNPNYLAPFLDAMGSEGNLKGNGEGPNWNPEILDYRRAIAYSRPYLFANQMTRLTASEAYTFTQLALFYGVAAGAGPNAAEWEPGAQQIVSDTRELVIRYWAAGWEPLTYARADSEDVWIERFGGPEFPRVPPSSQELGGIQGNSRCPVFLRPARLR